VGVTTPTFEPVRNKRNVAVRTSFLAVGIGFALAAILRQNVVNTVSSELMDPGMLRGATMTGGTTVGFWFEGDPVKFTLPRASIAKLLASRAVFNDCKDRGRVCSTPAWSNGLGFDIAGVSTPNDALCATSDRQAANESLLVCVDSKTDALYFSDSYLGGHSL
jgi:hypothetical protein